MISTLKLPVRVEIKPSRFPQIVKIVNDDGWIANCAENRVEFLVIACNFHERLRDQLQALVHCATEEELGNAMQLLAELAKEVQP